MIGMMNSLYLYLKAIHIIAAFAWMAGMFYLPRLYVYHAKFGPDAPQAETFKVMERGLVTVIMNPAMIVTVVLGLWLAFGADAVDPRAGGCTPRSRWLWRCWRFMCCWPSGARISRLASSRTASDSSALSMKYRRCF